MEISALRNFAELDMDQSLMHQWQTTSFDELNDLSSMATAAFCDNYYDMQLLSSSPSMFSQENLSENEAIIRPFKQQKTNSWEWDSKSKDHLSNSTTTSSASLQFHVINPILINDLSLMKPKEEIDFSSGSVSVSMKNLLPLEDSPTSVSNQNYVFNSCPGNKRAIRTNSKMANARDHIIAERKRREKLNQKFIALSALVPGLKKMDKATVLGDAIKYLKQLQEKVNNLEDQTRKQAMESVPAFVKKHELIPDSDNSFPDGNLSNDDVEIEARFSGKDVLVRIHCEKRKRILDKIVAEIEKLPLSVISSNVMTFGSYVLDITIIAQMEDGFIMPIKDFVKNLRSTLQRLINGKQTFFSTHSP